MFNRSEILHTAWANYRTTATLIGLATFSRKHFANCLRTAWEDAKLLAFYVALEADEATEAAINPAKGTARAELVALNMKDRWTSEDRVRLSELNGLLAA